MSQLSQRPNLSFQLLPAFGIDLLRGVRSDYDRIGLSPSDALQASMILSEVRFLRFFMIALTYILSVRLFTS